MRLEDSPIGLAAWMLDHDIKSTELITRVFDGQTEGLTREDVVNNITLYWLTGTAVSSARLYWETSWPSLSRHKARYHPGGGERVSGRDLSGSADLGGKGVPPSYSLQ